MMRAACILVLAALAVSAGGCATTSGSPNEAAAARAPRPGGVSAAISLLYEGRADEARKVLVKVLDRHPSDRRAASLLRQIDMQPEALLGQDSFAYRVRSGDTLSSLAQEHLGDPTLFYALARYNNLTLPATLSPGSSLRIPGREKAPPPARVAKPKPPTPPSRAPQVKRAGDPDRAAKLRVAGLEQLNRGNIDQAVALLEQAAASDPGDALARRDLQRAAPYQTHAPKNAMTGQNLPMTNRDLTGLRPLGRPVMNRVGRYELREKIGEGAMAEVWRAHDPSIDRDLAIKLLKPELSADPEYAERFLREARAAGALAHPAIVTIYDVGEAQGVPYIAMELLEGRTLDQILASEGKLPADRVLGIAGQLAAALSYAHLSGVVHRDIKPSNIMLGKDGVSIRILDFGIARVTESDVRRSEDEHARTQIGQVLGTPRYMSPEQALGQAVDGRSDLFSVGAVLYELITGKSAFSGSNAATLALQITQQNPPPIQALERSCPGGLRFLIDKLLAKRPERRFATAAELGRAVAREAKAYEAVLSEAASEGRYMPLPLRLTLAMVGVTALVLALSVGGVLHRQYRAMEHMALVSGSSIAAFVATNAALPSVENAAARPEERDWLPVQAFIAAASQDQSVRWMTMVDSEGVIRGSSDERRLGARYRPPAGEEVVYRDAKVTVTDVKLPDGQSGFRIVHPIDYAGRNFGMIEVSISKTELEGAAATSRNLLIGLSFIVLTVVGLVSFTLARLLSRPVLRLKSAMADAAMGDLDFRISHDRRDEFGRLFDGFNILADVVQERLEAAERPTGGPRAVEATQIAARPAPTPTSASKGTPFDRDFKRSA